jgi:hypothetical protein
LTIAEDEVVYKLRPEVKLMEAGMEESSEDHVAPEPPLPDPIPTPAPTHSHVSEPRRVAAPQPQHEAGPTREQPWRNIEPSTWELP